MGSDISTLDRVRVQRECVPSRVKSFGIDDTGNIAVYIVLLSLLLGWMLLCCAVQTSSNAEMGGSSQGGIIT